jgi:hypothetical protein
MYVEQGQETSRPDVSLLLRGKDPLKSSSLARFSVNTASLNRIVKWLDDHHAIET